MRPAYRTIVCATDLSPVGNAALPFAYALAGRGSTVHVLTVIDGTNGQGLHQGDLPLSASSQEESRQGALERARTQLGALCAAKPAPSGVHTEIHVQEGWDAARVIEDLSHTVRADVAVIGTHGRTGFGRVLMGSVATEVLRRRQIPLLLLHDADARQARGRAFPLPVPR